MKQACLFFAWLIALVSMCLSLYASEILLWPVCNLCWYQRICIYPLVIIIGIGAYRNTNDCVRYALPFTVLGALFGLYQYAEQMIPGFSPIGFCSAVSCSEIHFQLAGFITMPLLSVVGCVAMGVLLMLARKE
jgi:disulfide bond formation protein DsbB